MSVHSLNQSQTLSQFPHSRTSVKRVHLVESSPALRAVQEKKLQAWGGKNSLELHWHDSIEDIPPADGVYTMLVAHEFFDALPFHLIEVRRWHLYSCQTHTLNSHRKVIKVGKRF
jgi:SAM-dependent MidA family methyltransferase